MKNCEYARQYYGVPAEIGRRVVMNGRPGVIAEDRGQYVGVLFDDCKPGDFLPCHPTWEMRYGEMGAVRVEKLTKAQRRYRAWVRCDFSECFDDFLHFCDWWNGKCREDGREPEF